VVAGKDCSKNPFGCMGSIAVPKVPTQPSTTVPREAVTTAPSGREISTSITVEDVNIEFR
jgi:hypothetical protein